MANNGVSHAELMELNKDQLASAVSRAVDKAKTMKEKAAKATEEVLDFVFAGLGGGLAGYWLGSIQREINAGVEGYDEDSLKFFGVDKDLGVGLALAIGANVKQLKKFRAPLRAGGMGFLSFWTGRKAFNMALEKEVDDEEEGDEEGE